MSLFSSCTTANIRSVTIGLDLALIIGANSNLTTLRKDNVSRPYSSRITLVSPRIIIGKNLIQISGIKRYASVITMARKAI